MIIYYSGDNEGVSSHVAEELLKGVGVMLTFACHNGKEEKDNWRISKILKDRKEQ